MASVFAALQPALQHAPHQTQAMSARIAPARSPARRLAAPVAAARALRQRRAGHWCAAGPGVQAPASPDVQRLEQELAELMEAQSRMSEEDIAARVAEIERRSAELGLNTVDAAANLGSFRAAPLSGRLKKVTGADAKLTMGGLTFGAVQPADLELAFRPLPAGRAPIFKGERQGVANAYTVTSAFAVPGHGLAGLNEAVGTFEPDGQNPQRLTIAFTEVMVTPDWSACEGEDPAAARERWLALFAAANPAGSVDPATCCITVPLAAPMKAELDYLVMTPDWQMTRSNLGSVALLRRSV